MGLDMYFTRRNIKDNVEFECGYLRKANHIHGWMVENVCGGYDDCNEHIVDKGKLMELEATCERVLDSIKAGSWEIAKKELPITTGFFFGSYEYGEWYVDDIKKTLDIINKIMETTNFETEVVTYMASW